MGLAWQQYHVSDSSSLFRSEKFGDPFYSVGQSNSLKTRWTNVQEADIKTYDYIWRRIAYPNRSLWSASSVILQQFLTQSTKPIYTCIQRRTGGVWVFKPPTPKFWNFDKAEPNSQFRGIYIRNNLTTIRLSLIFWVVVWKALPARYDPPGWYFFFLSKAWRGVSIKYQKLRKLYHMKWNFLYQITAVSRTPD